MCPTSLFLEVTSNLLYIPQADQNPRKYLNALLLSILSLCLLYSVYTDLTLFHPDFYSHVFLYLDRRSFPGHSIKFLPRWGHIIVVVIFSPSSCLMIDREDHKTPSVSTAHFSVDFTLNSTGLQFSWLLTSGMEPFFVPVSTLTLARPLSPC